MATSSCPTSAPFRPRRDARPHPQRDSDAGTGQRERGVGLARTAPAREKGYRFLADGYLLSVYFHETYRDMLSRPVKVELTGREREVLCWASEGKTDDEMSTILNISENTIRFHWKNIFRKLEVYGRMYAVTKAVRLQLINPALVVTYRKR